MLYGFDFKLKYFMKSAEAFQRVETAEVVYEGTVSEYKTKHPSTYNVNTSHDY